MPRFARRETSSCAAAPARRTALPRASRGERRTAGNAGAAAAAASAPPHVADSDSVRKRPSTGKQRHISATFVTFPDLDSVEQLRNELCDNPTNVPHAPQGVRRRHRRVRRAGAGVPQLHPAAVPAAAADDPHGRVLRGGGDDAARAAALPEAAGATAAAAAAGPV